MDKISYFVLLSGYPIHVVTCLLHLLSLFVRTRSDQDHVCLLYLFGLRLSVVL